MPSSRIFNDPKNRTGYVDFYPLYLELIVDVGSKHMAYAVRRFQNFY